MEALIFDNKLERFIESLEKITIAKVLRTIDLLEKFGHQLEMPHSKIIGTGMLELRIRGMQEVRIFYTFHNGAAVLLHGYIKKTDRIPVKELAVANRKKSELDNV